MRAYALHIEGGRRTEVDGLDIIGYSYEFTRTRDKDEGGLQSLPDTGVERAESTEPTRAQLAIADYLQHGPKRLQISAFRGVGKSWITAAFVLWVLFNDPDKKIMVISASKERADNFSIFCQN